MKIIFLDTETTGLDVTRHEVWEFAAVEYSTESLVLDDPVGEHHLVWEPTWMEQADPGAIRVNKYYSRTRGMEYTTEEDGVDPSGHSFSDPYEAAKYIAWVCEDAIIVGNNPGFDEKFLEKFCREQSQVFAGFHRKLNVVDMALQRCRDMARGHHEDANLQELAQLAAQLPHSSSKVLNAAGCPENEGVHQALGDARHVRDAFFHLWG